MSDDGADLNMSAEGAMKAAMGGDQPERLSPRAFEQMIRTAEPEPATYDSAANCAARRVLEFLEVHPEHRDTPIENVYAEDADWSSPTVFKDSLEQLGLYDVMKNAGVNLGDLGLTGFQWGWAANAARNILGLDHQPNPAIIEIGSA